MTQPLAFEPTALLAAPESVDWKSYGTLLSSAETALVRLYEEVDVALISVDSAASTADGALEGAAATLADLRSRADAAEAHLDVASDVPLTGGQYTRIITESFRDSGARDRAASQGRDLLSLGGLPGSDLSCQPRRPLEVDRTSQTLRLAREADGEVFSGLPGFPSLGGTVTVDRIHGTECALSGLAWAVRVASAGPLLAGDPLPSWVPTSYSGGACVRLRVSLSAPAAVTELALSGDSATDLLEVVAAVDSRPDPLSPSGTPARALNASWNGDLGAAGISVEGTSRWGAAPDHGTGQALLVHGRASFLVPVRPATHYVLRFRVFCPYDDPNDSEVRPSGQPRNVEWVLGRVDFLASQSGPVLGFESFQDPCPIGPGYAGAPKIARLIASPLGAAWARVSLGTDAGLDFRAATAGAEIALSDVWLCDEAITLPQDLPLLGPGQGGDPVESRVPLGNDAGSFSFSDVWLTVGSPSATLSPGDPPASPVESLQTSAVPGLPFDRADPIALRLGRGLPEPPVPEKRAGGLFRRPAPSADPTKGRQRGRPAPSAAPAPTPAPDDGLHCYQVSLASLSLRRRAFAPSGLYLTLPLQDIGAGLSGEIREIGVVTDPPLPTLGGRVRLWVIPDSLVLAGTGRDSPGALLARAVPLDRARPRATFHCTAESLAGVAPAESDVAAAWETATGRHVPRPAFAVPPSLGRESSTGLPTSQHLLKLRNVPYINREAVRRVSLALTSGSAALPGVYDPNAVRPLVDLAVGGTYAVTGYRPVTLTLTLPNGAVVRPDSLGRPRPGELVFSGKEILRDAGDVESQHLPASPSAYAFSGADDPALSSRARLSFNRAFLTARSPIASGLQGASLSLWWHKSKDFDATKGGIQSGLDVLIPASDYEVDVATGHVTVHAPPPGSWQDYDQVVAEYFWRVGELAPREVFPQPDLASLYTPFSPYLVGGPVTGSAGTSTVLYKPTQPLLQGYADTATLVADPAFRAHAQSWTAFHHNNDDIWSNAGRGSSFNPHIADPWDYWFGDNTGEGVEQLIPYPGPGGGNFSLWSSYNADNHPDNYQYKIIQVVLEVVQGTVAVESYTFQLRTIRRGTPGLPCLAGVMGASHTSETDSSNLTSTPPSWFPAAAASQWPSFRAGLSASNNQTVYQYPSGHMSPVGNGFAVSASADGVPGTVDNVTTFAVSLGTRPEAPYGVRIPFTTPASPGLKLRVKTTLLDGSNDGQGVMGFRTDVWWTSPTFVQGCVAPYTYDSVTDQCKFTPVDPGTVTSGGDAGTLKPVPSDLADLLAGSLQQSYPVTRNVTDYEGGTRAPLSPVNMDPLSPDYHPVFEYRINPGGVPALATDFSDIGPYAGTKLDWAYDFLDVSPRIVLEVLPEGASALDLPDAPDASVAGTRTPELRSLCIVVNARS